MRLAFTTRRGRALASLAAGAVMALGQPPFGLWPLVFVAGAAALHLHRDARGRRAFFEGWLFGLGYFGVALHWIVEPFLVDAALHGWMAPFAFMILNGGLALFWGAAFLAAAAARDRLGATGVAARAGGLTAFLCAAEFTRSYIFTGFPWALPVYVWTDTPIAQLSSVVGPYGLSLATLALAFALGAALEASGRARLAQAGAVFAIVAGAWVWGSARIDDAPATGPLIRLVQTAVPQAEKWDVDRVESNFSMLLERSGAPLTGAPGEPTAIIWPESAVTFPIDMAPAARERIAEALGDASLILGSLRMDGGPDQEVTAAARWRNSLFLLDADAKAAAIFDKVHLVPFGEYLPMEEVFEAIGFTSMAQIGGGIVPGEAPVLMEASGAPTFAPLICYEMIFPRETKAAARGAAWMVLVTNDGWFGGWAGPAQHLAMAQFRAIEIGAPIARAANQGVSAMIDPYGRAVGAVGRGVGGRIDERLPAALPETIYEVQNETFTTFAMLLLFMSTTLGRNTSNYMKNQR